MNIKAYEMYRIAKSAFETYVYSITASLPSLLSFYRFMWELEKTMNPMLVVQFVIMLAGLCLSAFSIVTVRYVHDKVTAQFETSINNNTTQCRNNKSQTLISCREEEKNLLLPASLIFNAILCCGDTSD
jgi:hypothetical protein